MGYLVPPMPRPRARPRHSACTQCGAPDETGAHVCAYCLSPRHPAVAPQMIEVTTLGDPHPVYVRANPIAQPEPDRR